MSAFLRDVGGFTYCESVHISALSTHLDIKHNIKTPFIAYSKEAILNNINNYKDNLEKCNLRFLLCYSVKANFNVTLAKLFADQGCSLTAVSGNEVLLGLQIGLPGNRIVLNGCGKQEWELDLAVSNGCIINADSTFDLHRIINVAEKLGKCPSILLRLNPSIDPKCHPYLATGLGSSKFGLDDTSFEQALDLIKRCNSKVLLKGFHCHLGSTITDAKIYGEMVDVLLRQVDKCREMGFNDISYLNVGGGLGIDYTKQGTGATPLDVVQEINSKMKNYNLTLILEPGRSLIGNTAVLITTVLGTKCTNNKWYIVVDGSMTEVIRPSLYGAYHHISLAEPSKSEGTQIFDVVGPVCECGDFLGKDRQLDVPHEGCKLIVHDVGAYCSSMASNYNMRVRPAEILIDDCSWKIIRRPDTFQDIIRPYLENLESL